MNGIKEVTVRKLYKEYYMHDFDDINDINVSTVSLLVGKNGAGKSNFLNAIAGGDELEKEDRKMLLIYYDSVLDDYIIENYNMVAKYEKQIELLSQGTNVGIKSGNSKWRGPMTNTEYMFIGDFDKYPNANAWEVKGLMICVMVRSTFI